MKNTVESYKVLRNVCNKARDLAFQNQKYIDEFRLPIIGIKNKKSEIEKYFDSLQDKLLENSYLELIASFEAKVVIKIELISGEIKRGIKNQYASHLPFQNYDARFIKNTEDFSSLNKISKLLKGKINDENHIELEKVIKFRDKLAHGKRFNKGILLDSIEDTFTLLNSILEEIG